MSTKPPEAEPIEGFTDEELAQYLNDQREEIAWAVLRIRDDLLEDGECSEKAARVLQESAGDLVSVGEELSDRTGDD